MKKEKLKKAKTRKEDEKVVRHKIKNERENEGKEKRMKGFAAKPELIFFVIVAIVIIILFVGGAWMQGWLKGVVG